MLKVQGIGKKIWLAALVYALEASWCAAEGLKEGWNTFTLSTMTAGCTYAVITPQIAAARAKVGYSGEGIPPQFESTFRELNEKVETMCKCVSLLTAEKWTFEEAKSKENNPEMKAFIEGLITSNKCPLAFDLPKSTDK
jgi:hypothetical protein